MSGMRLPSQDQFRGCLIGQCLGDALGFLREGFPRADCETFVREVLPKWMQGDLAEGEFAGQYSDDSQLARELMQSFAACRGFAPADYARRISALFVEDRIVGRGMTTHNAAMRLAAGAPWESAGAPPPCAGNGSAMRAAPIGLFFHTPQEMIRAACDQGRITHQDPRAMAGCVAIAGAVFLAVRGKVNDKREFLVQLAEWVRPVEMEFANGLLLLGDLFEKPLEECLNVIAEMGLEPGHAGTWDRISPFVMPSVIWSLFSFLRHPEDYASAISTAIRGGGDVDTTAAMTGAMSGAYLGEAALPRHLCMRVNDLGTWGYSALVSLADQCFEVVRSKAAPVSGI